MSNPTTVRRHTNEHLSVSERVFLAIRFTQNLGRLDGATRTQVARLIRRTPDHVSVELTHLLRKGKVKRLCRGRYIVNPEASS